MVFDTFADCPIIWFNNIILICLHSPLSVYSPQLNCTVFGNIFKFLLFGVSPRFLIHPVVSTSMTIIYFSSVIDCVSAVVDVFSESDNGGA